MSAIVEDLKGIELVGESADAVLLGGADETEETGRVFSHMNLARAFAELEAGAELFCLHRNPWWQTKHGPLLDTGAYVAGLEYAAGVHATVLGKPSSSFFAAALETLDSDPGQALVVGDDLASDIRGAQLHGMRTALVRTGKFRPDVYERSGIRPTVLLSSIADLPEWLATLR
jgi:ribonucleotide monophosphatase NagD (HAD superfamily)